MAPNSHELQIAHALEKPPHPMKTQKNSSIGILSRNKLRVDLSHSSAKAKKTGKTLSVAKGYV